MTHGRYKHLSLGVTKGYHVVCADCHSNQWFEAPDLEALGTTARRAGWIRSYKDGYICVNCAPRFLACHPKARAGSRTRRVALTSKELKTERRPPQPPKPPQLVVDMDFRNLFEFHHQNRND